jgi:hypothetical protein
MRKAIFAIAAVALLVPTSNAWAGKHHPMTEAEQENCLMTDTDEDGQDWCVKSGVGMSKKQIDAFFRREGDKAAAEEANAPRQATAIACVRRKTPKDSGNGSALLARGTAPSGPGKS